MTRVVNFRPLFYLFLAFALGIAVAYYIFSLNLLVIGVVSLLIIAVSIFSIIRKKWKALIAVLLAFAFGIGGFFIDFAVFTNSKYNGQECSVVGRVEEGFRNYDDFVYVELSHVRINGKAEKNIDLMITTYAGEIDLETGDILEFNGGIYNSFLFENGVYNSFIYKKNLAYHATVDMFDVSIKSGNLSIAESVRYYIKDILNHNMGKDIASLAYSSLFGDKTELDADIKQNFSNVGIAHLLAVSGLHIALLVAVLFWLLKKLRCVGVPRFCIIAVFLLIYAYFCDFSPSVVRASLMCLIFLATGLFGRQYDLLSSIGLAGILILICKPLYVFDAGFLMSFASVTAIAILYKLLSKIFQKIKIPQKISDALAIDLATTLAIAPIIAIFFGKLSIFSWVANLFCIPLFSLVYSILFVMIIFVFAFKFLGFLLFVPELIFKIIVWIAGLVASIKWAIVPLYTLTIVGAILFYFILFVLSPFVMTNVVKKYITISVATIIGVVSLFVFSPIQVPKTYSYTQLNTYSAGAVLTSSGGEVLVVGNAKTDLEYIENYLKFKSFSKITTFVLTSDSTEEFSEFEKKYNIKYVVNYSQTLNYFGDFAVQMIYKNSNLKCVYINTNGVGFLIGVSLVGTTQAMEISSTLNGKNISVIYEKTGGYGFHAVANSNYYFTRLSTNYNAENNFATMNMSSFTFDFKNAILGKVRSVN